MLTYATDCSCSAFSPLVSHSLHPSPTHPTLLTVRHLNQVSVCLQMDSGRMEHKYCVNTPDEGRCASCVSHTIEADPPIRFIAIAECSQLEPASRVSIIINQSSSPYILHTLMHPMPRKSCDPISGKPTLSYFLAGSELLQVMRERINMDGKVYKVLFLCLIS